MSVRVTIQYETTKIQECIRKMAPSDELLSERLRLLKPRGDKEEEPSMKVKSLHGIYH